MTARPETPIPIHPAAGPASRIRSELSDLLAAIASARSARALRDDGLRSLHDRLELELGPLEAKLGEARKETLLILCRHLAEGGLRRRDGERLRDALLGLADYLERDFGLDLEAERVDLLGQAPRRGKALRPRPEAGPDRAESPPGAGPRAGTRQGRKRAAEEAAIAGDVRALYLLLARALHPDKEPEAERREAKTAWMQKVTDAYGRRDLAGLLDILGQDPLGAVGPYLDRAPAKTVQGFAKRLRRELAALRAEAEAASGGLHPSLRAFLGPRGLNEKALKRAVTDLKRELRFVKERNEAYRDPAVVEDMIGEMGKGDPRAYL